MSRKYLERGMGNSEVPDRCSRLVVADRGCLSRSGNAASSNAVAAGTAMKLELLQLGQPRSDDSRRDGRSIHIAFPCAVP